MEEFESRLKVIEDSVNIMSQKRILVVRTIVANFGIHGFIKSSDLETGIVLRDMIPITGKVTKVHLFVESIVMGEKERKAAELTVAIDDNKQMTLSKGIRIGEGYQDAPISLDVVAGSRITVRSSRQLLGVWYGLTIEPSIQHRQIESAEE